MEDAIRVKRKAAKQFAKEKTPENWEIKRRTRNEASKEWRIAIKAYWDKITQEIDSKPSDFFKSFKPFLGTKKQSIGRDLIKIDIKGEIRK